MKFLKIVAVLVIVYALIVTAFESLIGYFQPADETTLVITTRDDSGAASDRVLSSIDYDGQLYVAANHWPRAWYRQALENPQVQVTRNGETGDYLAVPVEGAEHAAVDAARPLGPLVRFLTGYPPRYFLRLEPG